MKDSTNFNMYPRGVHDAQSAVRLDIRAPGDDAESSVESDHDARGESPAHIEAQLAGPAARQPCNDQALKEVSSHQGYQSQVIAYPSEIIGRWFPSNRGSQLRPHVGPRSRTGRPVRPVNRFSGLSSEMAIDGDKSILEPRTVKEALAGKNAAKWLASMESGIDNI
jgi:hypothetical protein